MGNFFRKNFADSLKLIKSKPSFAAAIVILDASFIVSFAILQILFTHLAQYFPVSYISLPAIILLSIVYYAIVILAYSFFKYCVLAYTKGLFGKMQIAFGRFWKFFSLNLLIALVFFAIMMAFNYILGGLKPAFVPYVFLAIAAPYLAYLYFALNIAHISFYEGAFIGKSLKKGLSDLFLRPRRYLGIILFILFMAAAAWAVLLLAGYGVRSAANYTSYLKYYGHLKQSSVIFSYLVAYLVVYLTRINFYSVLKGK